MYDIAIIGGGLAGLTNGILLARTGMSVILFEKNEYPFHRVCGEYISNEVKPFLLRQDLFPEALGPTEIFKFVLSSTNGHQSGIKLALGGFGISRYRFDHFLYQKALESGVEVKTKTTVDHISPPDGGAHDHFIIQSAKNLTKAKIVLGAHGKRSKLDAEMGRGFMTRKSPYIGVKYHIKTDYAADTIALHNFQGGYCGISPVEKETFNLCYLSHRDNLKVHGNLPNMEKEVLYQNPFLKDIFINSEFVRDKPLVINEITFEKKNPVEGHILMCGDAAGMIAPLCGNGMAMAIRSATKLSEIILQNWNDGNPDRQEIEKLYTKSWNEEFRFRLWAGKKIQGLFGSAAMSNLVVNMIKIRPLAKALINLTHGKEF